jgi:hypothetical protein
VCHDTAIIFAILRFYSYICAVRSILYNVLRPWRFHVDCSGWFGCIIITYVRCVSRHCNIKNPVLVGQVRLTFCRAVQMTHPFMQHNRRAWWNNNQFKNAYNIYVRTKFQLLMHQSWNIFTQPPAVYVPQKFYLSKIWMFPIKTRTTYHFRS